MHYLCIIDIQSFNHLSSRQPLTGFIWIWVSFNPRRCRGLLAATPNGIYMDLGLLYPPPCWRSIPRAKSITARNAGVNSPAPYFSHLPKADVSSHSPFMKRGIGREVTTPMASADQMDWILGDNVTIVDMDNGG